MSKDDRFILTDNERNSPLWQRLRTHYAQKLNVLRLRNDGPIDFEKTLELRGRISEAKAFLSINDAMPSPIRKE